MAFQIRRSVPQSALQSVRRTEPQSVLRWSARRAWTIWSRRPLAARAPDPPPSCQRTRGRSSTPVLPLCQQAFLVRRPSRRAFLRCQRTRAGPFPDPGTFPPIPPPSRRTERRFLVFRWPRRASSSLHRTPGTPVRRTPPSSSRQAQGRPSETFLRVPPPFSQRAQGRRPSPPDFRTFRRWNPRRRMPPSGRGTTLTCRSVGFR